MSCLNIATYQAIVRGSSSFALAAKRSSSLTWKYAPFHVVKNWKHSRVSKSKKSKEPDFEEGYESEEEKETVRRSDNRAWRYQEERDPKESITYNTFFGADSTPKKDIFSQMIRGIPPALRNKGDDNRLDLYGPTYVSTNDPAEITEASSYFQLSKDDISKYFPEGVAGYLRHEFDYASMFDKCAIMHRGPARRLINHIRRVASGDESAQRHFYIRGERGTGKSATINHAVHFARTHGWIVLFAPDGRKFFTSGIYCQPSERYAGMYDTPVHAQRMLVDLMKAHGHQLREIIVTDPELLERYSSYATESDLSLFDIATPGMPAGTGVGDKDFEKAEEAASNCFLDIYKILMETDKFPVMIAIDEYSELFQPSPWHHNIEHDFVSEVDIGDADYEKLVEEAKGKALIERIPPEKLTCIAPFFVFRPPEDGGLCSPEKFTPKRGMVIAAETHNYPYVKISEGDHKFWPLYDDIIGTSVDPWVLEVPNYSVNEFNAAVSHYFQCKMFERTDIGNRDVLCVRVKTAMNPKLVFHKFSFKSHG